jgi:hypothetical protein
MRMMDAISVVADVCGRLECLDLPRAAAACSSEKISIWATKAEDQSRKLTKVAARLKGATTDVRP